jgi:hypothetical protein
VTRFWQSSNAQCEQCNHTHSENQHCKCYRIVVQPMQPLLHGTPPVSDQWWVSESATETTSPVALGSAVQKGKHPNGLVRLQGTKGKTRHWAKVVAGFPGPCALSTRRLIGVDMCDSPCVWVKRTGTGRQVLSFWVMNRFRPKPAMSRVTIAVALMGAAITIGLAIWQSYRRILVTQGIRRQRFELAI